MNVNDNLSPLGSLVRDLQEAQVPAPLRLWQKNVPRIEAYLEPISVVSPAPLWHTDKELVSKVRADTTFVFRLECCLEAARAELGAALVGLHGRLNKLGSTQRTTRRTAFTAEELAALVRSRRSRSGAGAHS